MSVLDREIEIENTLFITNGKLPCCSSKYTQCKYNIYTRTDTHIIPIHTYLHIYTVYSVYICVYIDSVA